MRTPKGLKLQLPPGWVTQTQAEGEPLLVHHSLLSSGVLHVSEFTPDELSTVSRETDLAAFSRTVAKGIAAHGANWGALGIARQGECALGRFGASVFTGGDFAVMILWITVSSDTAYLWTWFGPDPAAEEVKQAFQIVLTAQGPN